MHRRTQTRALPSARLPIAAGVLALLVALGLDRGRGGPRRGRRRTAAQLRRDPDRRPDARPALRLLHPSRRVADRRHAQHAEPDRQARHHLQPLLRLLPALLPLAGHASSPAATPTTTTTAATCRPTAAIPASPPRTAFSHNIATWLQGAGYRTIHVGKFLNGYGDEPFDNGKTVPPGLERLAHGAQRRHRPLLLRLHAERQRVDRRSLRRLGQLGNARIRRPRRLRLPVRPAQRAALLLRDRRLHRASRPKSSRARRRTGPSTCSSTTPPRTATSAARPGPEPAPRHYDSFLGAPLPHSRSQGFDEGNVNDKPSFIREAPYLSLDRNPHLPRLLPEGAGVAALGRRRREADRRHARRACTASATPTSSSPPTTASSSASTASPAASSSPTSPRPTCPS